jgi:hypothetical protein
MEIVMARLDRAIALLKLALTGLVMLMARSSRAMTCVGDSADDPFSLLAQRSNLPGPH